MNTKSASLTKVVAQETVTTPAGTFETFKIERQMKEFIIADPSRYWDTQMLMWFAPQNQPLGSPAIYRQAGEANDVQHDR